MKIDSTTSSSTTSSAVTSEARQRGSVSKASSGAAAEVHLSELAAHLQSAGETPAFDATRVAEIKQAIAEGRFAINPEAVADRLIESASELINSQRQRQG